MLEGVAFAFRDSLEALKAAGTQLDRVTAIGAARGPALAEGAVDGARSPHRDPADGDFGAAFGAARLGLIAAEGADPEAVCTPPAIAETIAPDAGLADAYEAAYHRYRALYPAIAGATR